VGVSVSGTVHSSSGWVRAAENLGWFDVDVGQILSKGISTTFHFENDAKLGALAERWYAKPGGPRLENFVFLTLHQGLGTGIIIEGRPLHGFSGQASEFGHTTLFADGRPCVCGGIGCWEEYASERAMERLYRERTPSGPDAKPSAERIIALAREGDPIAVDVLRETAQYVGMGLANLNAAFNPEAIIVDGHLADAWDLMGDWVWETLRHRAPQRYLTNLRIFPSSLGRDSSFKGAIALVLSRFFAGTGQNQAPASSASSAQSLRTR
jgi:predicted NBD/HSP70 family sugar kinase